jgi:glyoxylase-like metal-dependent hydrolase (beta-lactamase superfamily II)
MEFEIIPVTRLKQNCSVLWCEKTRKAAVIDPGGDLAEIVNTLDLLDLEPEVALITHGHFDHCGGAAQFAEMTGVRIEGPHRADAPVIAGSTEFAERYGIRARPYTPARWLEDGDVIRFGEEELQVLHCPGHCRGHVAYFSPSARWAFVGDILFKGTIGAWEHSNGDLPTLVASITGKLFPLGDDVRFVPGHGPTSTMGEERLSNPFVGKEAMARWKQRFPAEQAR